MSTALFILLHIRQTYSASELDSINFSESIWLWRYVQVLAALGESAFRELTQYFDWIPTRELPEWLTPYLNVSVGAFVLVYFLLSVYNDRTSKQEIRRNDVCLRFRLLSLIANHHRFCS